MPWVSAGVLAETDPKAVPAVKDRDVPLERGDMHAALLGSPDIGYTHYDLHLSVHRAKGLPKLDKFGLSGMYLELN